MTSLNKFEFISINDHQKECFLTDTNERNVYLILDAEQKAKLRQLNNRLITFQTSDNINNVPTKVTHEEIGILISNDTNLKKTNIHQNEICFSHTICKHLSDDMKDPSFARLKCDYESYLSKSIDEQNSNLKNQRIEQMETMREKILDGKRKKLNMRLEKVENEILKANDDKELKEKLQNEKLSLINQLENLENNFINDNEKKTQNLSHENLLTEIFIKTPEFYSSFFNVKKLSVDTIRNTNMKFYESNKFKIFKYFWSLGYYLTCGLKFGGDYLVYPGDPSSYHSQFILVCIEDISTYRSLSLKNLITYARMATSVKKTIVLAFCCKLDESSSVQRCTRIPKEHSILIDNGSTELHLISINWSHF